MESIIAKKDKEIRALEESLSRARREATKSSDLGKEERELLSTLRRKVTDLEDSLQAQSAKSHSELTKATATIETLNSEVAGLKKELQEANDRAQASHIENETLRGMKVDMPKVIQSVQDGLREQFQALVATHDLVSCILLNICS